MNPKYEKAVPKKKYEKRDERQVKDERKEKSDRNPVDSFRRGHT